MADNMLTVKKNEDDRCTELWNTESLTANIIQVHSATKAPTKLNYTVTNLQITLHGVNLEKWSLLQQRGLPFA
jgi:hypothetical protein